MGRYYDDRISLVGLDPANAFFQALQNAADAVDRAESDWYQRRKDVFDELDFGGFNKTDGQVEAKYASLKRGLSVYDFKTEFDRVNPSRRTASNVYRFVHNTFPKSGISDGYSTDRYIRGEEDDDGDSGFEVATDVLNYHVDRGKGSVDTLYDDLSAFRTSLRSNTDFYEFIDDDEPGYFSVNDVFRGFGQVPLAWNSKSGYTSQQLQVMNAAGNDYNNQVGPAISAYTTALSNYNGAGGGSLDSDTYKGVNAGEFVVGVEYQIKEPGNTNFIAVGAANNLAGTRFIATGAGSGNGIATAAMFPYQDFVGADTSYNRPQNLPAALINEARGFGS